MFLKRKKYKGFDYNERETNNCDILVEKRHKTRIIDV